MSRRRLVCPWLDPMSFGLLCPGQGDQTPGMLGVLKGASGAEKIWEIFARETGRDAFALCAEEMQVNLVAQPLVCAFQLAVWAAIGDRLPSVRALAGYSVGELAAYGCAGALSPKDVIALARQRALLMDDAFPGGGAMLALRGLNREAVRSLCARHGVEIGIVNDDDRIVVGGAPEAVAACAVEAQARGAKVTPLAIHIPSHTSLMQPPSRPSAARSKPWSGKNPRRQCWRGSAARLSSPLPKRRNHWPLNWRKRSTGPPVSTGCAKEAAPFCLNLAPARGWRAWRGTACRKSRRVRSRNSAALKARWTGSRANWADPAIHGAPILDWNPDRSRGYRLALRLTFRRPPIHMAASGNVNEPEIMTEAVIGRSR